MGKIISQTAGYVHVEDPESPSGFVVYAPGDEVDERHDSQVGDHCTEAGDPPLSEVDFAAGPSQGLGGLSEADRKLLEKAKKAEASRRSREAKAAKESDAEREKREAEEQAEKDRLAEEAQLQELAALTEDERKAVAELAAAESKGA